MAALCSNGFDATLLLPPSFARHPSPPITHVTFFLFSYLYIERENCVMFTNRTSPFIIDTYLYNH
jgi:hypothetical protein